jgi:hypothetical protein
MTGMGRRCRQQARRQQRRCANSRHQQSPEGQLDHRDRQREYRRRRQALSPVTDEGSLSITSTASFDCGWADAVKHPPAPLSGQEIQPWLWLRCRICGRTGRFIDPFSAHSTTKVSHRMISPETRARIRRYYYAEHWKIGRIASELGVHPDAVRHAIESERFTNSKPLGVSVIDPYDPYMEFIRHTLDQPVRGGPSGRIPVIVFLRHAGTVWRPYGLSGARGVQVATLVAAGAAGRNVGKLWRNGRRS